MIVRCLMLTPDRVPRSIIVSQGTLLGGAGRSWSVLVFILNDNFPDSFLQDEDPEPVDGNHTRPMAMFSMVMQMQIRVGNMNCRGLGSMCMLILVLMRSRWLMFKRSYRFSPIPTMA